MESSEFKEHHIAHAVLGKVRAAFPGASIWCGGFTNRESAQAALDTRLVDLIAFGRPYIANPDLCRASQARLALSRSGPINLLYPARRGGLHGLPCISDW
jgi:N-ethylmaleimide reductase